MLIVICGEDSQSARAHLNSVIDTYKKKGVTPRYVNKDALIALSQKGVQEISLFNEPYVYIIDGLNKSLNRKSAKDTLWNALDVIVADPSTILIDWERDVSARDLKISKIATVKEFKPSQSVFSLNDACVPGNLNTFVKLLNQVATPKDEMLVYVLLSRHIRMLVLAALNQLPANVPPWQRGKIAAQAKRWSTDQLIGFYDKIVGIEIALKTGRSVYSLKNSIELVSCYFLK